jgi:hypothetical protein
MNDLLLELAKRKKTPTIRAQLLVALPEIQEALTRGYSLADIHRVLKDQGRFNGSYSFLRQIIRAQSNKVLLSESTPESGSTDKTAVRENLERFAATAPQRSSLGWHKRSAKELL